MKILLFDTQKMKSANIFSKIRMTFVDIRALSLLDH